MKTRDLLAVASLWVALLPTTDAQATLARDIRDWRVICSNGLTCTMSFSGPEAKGIRSLGFRRSAAAGSGVELVLSAPPGFDAQADADARYEMVIDGKLAFTLPVAKLTPERYGLELVYTDQPVVLALLEAMKTGTSMELHYRGKQAPDILPVKLSGVRASMLLVDEAQERLGRIDALEAKGEKSPPSDLLAKDLSSVEDLPKSIRADFDEENGACGGLDGDFGNYGGFDILLGSTRVIVAPCGTGGAYNQPYAVYFSYDVITERGNFPGFREAGPIGQSTAYNVDFDPKTKEFTSFFRGRGIGDCGSWYKWRFSDSGSPTLVLLEERNKEDCDGNNMGGPENFPLVWPAKK